MNKLRNSPGKVRPNAEAFKSLLLTSLTSSPYISYNNSQKAVQQRALRVLQQKKMYENQLAQLTQQSFNMESTAIATENLRNTMATMDAMQTANKELKRQYGKVDVDKIEVTLCSLIFQIDDGDCFSVIEHAIRYAGAARTGK